MTTKTTVPMIRDCADKSYTTTVDRAAALRAGRWRIGAQKVGASWYYVAEETNEVYRLTERELISLGAGEIDGRGSDYSLWCSQTGQIIARPSKAVKLALGVV